MIIESVLIFTENVEAFSALLYKNLIVRDITRGVMAGCIITRQLIVTCSNL